MNSKLDMWYEVNLAIYKIEWIFLYNNPHFSKVIYKVPYNY